MEIEVIWSKRANLNLEHIFQYIVQDSEYYAERFVRDLIVQTDSKLSTFPNIGRTVPELSNTLLKHLRELIFKGYRIVYDPSQLHLGKVYVIAVLNGRMDLMKYLDEDWIIT